MFSSSAFLDPENRTVLFEVPFQLGVLVGISNPDRCVQTRGLTRYISESVILGFLLTNVGFDQWFPSERVFPEEDEEFSATLKAVRYAHALRGFDEAGGQIPADAVATNGDSKHYYYLV